MQRSTLIRLTAAAMLAFTTAGCGGGGNGGGTTVQPKSRKAILTLTTSGTPSAQMAGIGITVVLPAGVTPALETDGSVAATTVEVTGDAAPGTVLAPTYAPAGTPLTPAPSTTVSRGTLSFAMASARPAGFGAGEFATVTLNTTTSTLTKGDFSVTDFASIGLTGRAVSGLTPDFTLSVQ